MCSQTLHNDKQNDMLYDMIMMQYASCALPENHQILVESHLALSSSGMQTLRTYESLGGALLNALEPDMPMEAGSLDQVLAKLDDIEQDQTSDDQPACVSDCPVYPKPLVEYCGWVAQSTPWSRVLPGVASATPSDKNIQLLKVDPGVAMPEHDHRDLELTLLLEGSYTDETGRYARGDLVVMDRDMEHKPVADPQTGCICLITKDAPLRFTGLLGPVLNLFSR